MRQRKELSFSTAGMMSSPSSTARDAGRYFGTTGSPLFHQVTEWLELVTYKPGWRFELGPIENYHVVGHYVGRLWTRFKCKDSLGRYNPRHGDQFEVVSNHLVPEYLCEDQRQFYTYLHRCITETEMHELDEWFKVGGRLVSNPHDPNDPEVWSPGNERFKKKPPARWSFDEAYMMKEEFLAPQIQRKAGD